MSLDELFHRLLRSRGKLATQNLSTDDVLKAIEKLRILGNGFSLIQLGKGRFLIQSVPGELSLDQNQVIKAAQESASITADQLQGKLGWQEERSRKVLSDLCQSGLSWIDNQGPRGSSGVEIIYWFPSLFDRCI